MKLDYECIRHILLTIEENNSKRLTVSSFCSENYLPETISEHIRCLLDVSYIETSQPLRVLGCTYSDYIVKRLTMQGHEYLNTIRDNNVWLSTLKKIGSKTASVSLDIIKSVATNIIKSQLGI